MIDLKPFAGTLEKNKVLVVGLGKTGMSALKTLKQAGVDVVAYDDNPERLEGVEVLGVQVLSVELQDFSEFDCVILSPGIPLTHPEPHRLVRKAEEANVEVIGDIEVFYRNGITSKTIGITGTNGKSTTSALTHHILEHAGKKAVLGGNIGHPVLDIDMPAGESCAVLEMSSYQIDLCPTFRPDIGVVMNISSDHIDRHGSVEEYAAVKQKIVGANDSGYNGGTAIICTDDEFTRKIYAEVKEEGLHRAIPVSVLRKEEGGVYVHDGILIDNIGEAAIEVGDLAELVKLKGGHNHQNAACAYAVARIAGLKPEEIFEAMRTFKGLQHRQYLVRTINGVAYINDSKATNGDAASMALDCHNNIYWILGGRKKETGLKGLEIFADRVRHAFLIGEAAEDFGEWMDNYGIEYTQCGKLDKAVEAAHEMAQKGRGQPGGAGTVLFSPACASFDQFKSFEDRGKKYTDLVWSLIEEN